METWEIIEKRWETMEQVRFFDKGDDVDFIPFKFAHNDIKDLLDEIEKLQNKINELSDYIDHPQSKRSPK